MFKRNFLRDFILLFLQFAFVGVVLGETVSKVIEQVYVNVPDDVAFFDENANKHFLDEFEGKTLLLVFWATWCSPCVKEMPDLDILQKDFRKLPFKILPISQDFQGVKIVKNFYEGQEIRYLDIYHDYQNQLFKAFSVVGLPTSFLINPEGKIVATFTGNINWYDDEVRKVILSHIPGNPPEPKNSYKSHSLNQQVKPLKLKDKALAQDSVEEKVQENDKLDKEQNVTTSDEDNQKGKQDDTVQKQ